MPNHENTDKLGCEQEDDLVFDTVLDDGLVLPPKPEEIKTYG